MGEEFDFMSCQCQKPPENRTISGLDFCLWRGMMILTQRSYPRPWGEVYSAYHNTSQAPRQFKPFERRRVACIENVTAPIRFLSLPVLILPNDLLHSS